MLVAHLPRGIRPEPSWPRPIRPAQVSDVAMPRFKPKEERMKRNRLLIFFAGTSMALFGAPSTVPQAGAATFTVDTTEDGADATPGDAACATTGGACSLRAAIQEANMLPGPDVVKLPAG